MKFVPMKARGTVNATLAQEVNKPQDNTENIDKSTNKSQSSTK